MQHHVLHPRPRVAEREEISRSTLEAAGMGKTHAANGHTAARQVNLSTISMRVPRLGD